MCQTGEQIRILGSYPQAAVMAAVMLGVGLTKVRACYESSIWGFSIKLAKYNEEGDLKKRQKSKRYQTERDQQVKLNGDGEAQEGKGNGPWIMCELGWKTRLETDRKQMEQEKPCHLGNKVSLLRGLLQGAEWRQLCSTKPPGRTCLHPILMSAHCLVTGDFGK